MNSPTPFPSTFLWGAATAAYQIEGSPLADGAGPSIWHRFVRTPGMVRDGDTGDVACDHYRRFESDVALMKQLGLNAYRFSWRGRECCPRAAGASTRRAWASTSGWSTACSPPASSRWSRCTTGTCPRRWTTAAAGSTPTSPTGSPTTRSVMFRALDDRVKLWATLNEPWVVTDGGYLFGALAPGHRNRFEAPIASHHLMRSHGKAVQAYRALGRHQIGLVVNIEPKYPASDSADDRAATERAHAYMNQQYLDPALLGRYPDEMGEIFGEAWPQWPAEDMKGIRQPLDFVGINYYTRSVTRHDEAAWPVRASRVLQKQATYTETGWEVFPQGLTDTLLWIKQRYGDIPQYITENGAAFFDPPVAEGGRIDDPLRVDYLRKHIGAAARRAARGRRPARLFRLVAAGQPGVVAGLLQALRSRARRLRERRRAHPRPAHATSPT